MSKTLFGFSSESFKSTPEKLVKHMKTEDVHSESELFGVTTLQNIFRSVSSIESSHESVEEKALRKTSTCRDTSANSCCNEQENCSSKCNNSNTGDGIGNVSNIDNAKHLSAVLNPILTAEKSIRSSIVNGIGDSSVGTPV